MKKFSILTIILVLAGIACFSVAGYLYSTLRDYYEMFVYYNIESQLLTNSEVRLTVYNLKFGILKFSIFGIAAWIAALMFFLRRKKRNS
jgi:hypothetical protein